MKKTLIFIIIAIISVSCFSITVYLKDSNQLTGEIKKIDKEKIYISPRETKTLFIVKKNDIKMIMDGEIDLTANIINQKSQGKINYNSYLDIIYIELDNNVSNINYTAKVIAKNETNNNLSKRKLPMTR